MSSALVSTEWVAERLGTPGVRVFEVSNEQEPYAGAHLPGAVAIDWERELVENGHESGLVPGPERIAALALRLGLRSDDTLVFYGDQGGRHACRALWVFEYYRHAGALHVMDGGRERWEREGRSMTAEAPEVTATNYPAPAGVDESIRATWEEIAGALGGRSYALCDVRTQGEYAGEDVRAERGGRIPGARRVEWNDALTTEGTFRSKEELAALYAGFGREGTVTAYCQLGVRAAHTWFVLRHVLGYPNVKNYDGSWQEWGNRDDVPVEK